MQIHCCFLLEKCENLLQFTFFQQKISVFVIFEFEILTNEVVNFEQPAPDNRNSTDHLGRTDLLI